MVKLSSQTLCFLIAVVTLCLLLPGAAQVHNSRPLRCPPYTSSQWPIDFDWLEDEVRITLGKLDAKTSGYLEQNSVLLAKRLVIIGGGSGGEEEERISQTLSHKVLVAEEVVLSHLFLLSNVTVIAKRVDLESEFVQDLTVVAQTSRMSASTVRHSAVFSEDIKLTIRSVFNQSLLVCKELFYTANSNVGGYVTVFDSLLIADSFRADPDSSETDSANSSLVLTVGNMTKLYRDGRGCDAGNMVAYQRRRCSLHIVMLEPKSDSKSSFTEGIIMFSDYDEEAEILKAAANDNIAYGDAPMHISKDAVSKLAKISASLPISLHNFTLNFSALSGESSYWLIDEFWRATPLALSSALGASKLASAPDAGRRERTLSALRVLVIAARVEIKDALLSSIQRAVAHAYWDYSEAKSKEASCIKTDFESLLPSHVPRRFSHFPRDSGGARLYAAHSFHVKLRSNCTLSDLVLVGNSVHISFPECSSQVKLVNVTIVAMEVYLVFNTAFDMLNCTIAAEFLRSSFPGQHDNSIKGSLLLARSIEFSGAPVYFYASALVASKLSVENEKQEYVGCLLLVQRFKCTYREIKIAHSVLLAYTANITSCCSETALNFYNSSFFAQTFSIKWSNPKIEQNSIFAVVLKIKCDRENHTEENLQLSSTKKRASLYSCQKSDINHTNASNLETSVEQLSPPLLLWLGRFIVLTANHSTALHHLNSGFRLRTVFPRDMVNVFELRVQLLPPKLTAPRRKLQFVAPFERAPQTFLSLLLFKLKCEGNEFDEGLPVSNSTDYFLDNVKFLFSIDDAPLFQQIRKVLNKEAATRVTTSAKPIIERKRKIFPTRPGKIKDNDEEKGKENIKAVDVGFLLVFVILLCIALMTLPLTLPHIYNKARQ